MAAFYWGQGGQPLSQDDIERQYQTANALLQRADNTPARSWEGALGNAIYELSGKFHERGAREGERQNDDYNQNTLAQLLQQGSDGSVAPVFPVVGNSAPVGAPAQPISPVAAALTNPQTGEASPTAQSGASDLIAQGLLDHMRQAESGGDNAAKNPRSSATGAFQFTNPTWTGLMRQHPELGLTADGRTDPAQSETAAKQLASDNIAYMLAKGVQNPTQGQAYLAHFAGAPAATNLIQADPSAPASSILSPAQVAANPFLRGMTAGQVQDWAAQKMGGSAPQAPQMPAPQPSSGYGAPAPVQSGPSMSALIGVLSDPRANQQTRGVASALLNNQLQLQQVQQRYTMEQADPENVARRRYYDAETQHLINQPAKQGPEYNLLSPQQAQQMGLDPSKSYQMDATGKIMQIGGSGVSVSVNTGNGGVADAASKAYATKSGENLAAQEQDGEKSGSLMGLGKTLEYLAPQIGGGGLTAEMANRLGAYMPAGWKPQGQGQREQFQSLVSDAIRQSHVPGEGQQSDADAARLSATMPQIMNSPQGNIAIARTIQALAQRKMDIGKLAGQQGRGEITPAQRAEAVRNLPDPYASVRSFWQGTPQPGQAAQSAPTVSGW
ncbi:lysozyme family protein [Acetobacter cerevisiae]|uniref:hypothetical protein n=1 Tax=Acetobacter cerevisiae TaxID=178900 RepID=UPI00209CF5DF|nr:hypothetical protein [Acetobacter cerevisiae]MCP1270573.1 hypothetical protein [Acetobacter cerevisiae]MCP1278527.1 hypothetical protein [Acetobacter cerevisiae]